jgi:hypothetical protein
MLSSPGRLRAAGTNWVAAAVAFDVAAAHALAKDLRSQLARTDIDPDTRSALLSAIGSVAGRLKEGGEEVNALAKDLRSQLARTDIDTDTWQQLCDALALTSGKLLKQGGAANLLVSVALPLREPSQSPAWVILEQAARRSFNGDARALIDWAMQQYGLPPGAARPDFLVK